MRTRAAFPGSATVGWSAASTPPRRWGFASTRSGRAPSSTTCPAASFGFNWTINAFRGCTHACTFCFARRTHPYLGFDAGRDFEREIVVKVNAPEVLRAELARPSWKRDLVAIGTNTDPYQWAESRYRFMPEILAALERHSTPVSVLTKSSLVMRDVEIFERMAKKLEVSVNLSVPTLDEKAWRATEPHTPHPRKRLEAVAELRRRGIPSGVLVAPLMPGINDAPEQVEPIVELAREAGATFLGGVALHLRGEVRDVFFGWLEQKRPDLLPRYERLYPDGRALHVLAGAPAGDAGGQGLGPVPGSRQASRRPSRGATVRHGKGAEIQPKPRFSRPGQLGSWRVRGEPQADRALLRSIRPLRRRGDELAATLTDAHFQDPAFGDLNGPEVGAMWRMLTSRATDLEIELASHDASETTGSANWIARYTFGATGRHVVNDVRATFRFSDGLITDHVDEFDFRRWARQALGIRGVLIGAGPAAAGEGPLAGSRSARGVHGLRTRPVAESQVAEPPPDAERERAGSRFM